MKNLAILLLVSLSTFNAAAGGRRDVEASFVRQESAPVRWASMGESASHDLAYGYLRNFSEKEVVAVQGGWVTLVGCVDVRKPHTYDVTLGTLQNVRIPPRDLSPEIGFGILENVARSKMKAQGANTATVAVGIVRVVFFDGSEWNLNPNLMVDPTFDDDLEFLLTENRTCMDDTEAGKKSWCDDPANKNPPLGHEGHAKAWKDIADTFCGRKTQPKSE